MKILKTRRQVKIVLRVAKRCRWHGLEVRCYERIGYLIDGY